MRFVFGFFLKRLPREGIKSLSAPALVLALVFLINLLGGFRAWQVDEYNDVMENYPIISEVGDSLGTEKDGIYIDAKHLNVFTDPEAIFTLQPYIESVLLRRPLVILEVFGETAEIPLIGITSPEADGIGPDSEIKLVFYQGFDQEILRRTARVCLISPDLTHLPQNGVLEVAAKSMYGGGGIVLEGFDYARETLTVVGIVEGAENLVYMPFWIASEMGQESDKQPPYTERLTALLSNNSQLNRYKESAWRTFLPMSFLAGSRPYTLTIYDSMFYDLTETIMQNIFIIDLITPYIYYMSIAAGVVASFLITRRRKPEFAIMRSIGVKREAIFAGVLLEQALMGIIGTALGCVAFTLTWGYVFIRRPLVFFACYLVGSAFAALRAAGTDVLKILREKE